jgi:IclR family transcriptional regulator, KDG regulon repressor
VEVRSVSKAIRLIEALGMEAGPVGVSDLARRLEMDKSSVSRMLRTLEQAGFVAQDPATQRYTLGLALGVLGHKALRRLDLHTAARPSIEKLADLTGECSHIAVLADNRALYIDQVPPQRGVMVDSPMYTLAPLYCTALGKALLAFQTDPVRERIISSLQFEPYTRRTILNRVVLDGHLIQVRRDRVAHDDEEYSIGVRCIAAPVFKVDGTACGAIGISGPSPRMTDDRVREWEIAIRDEAAVLSRRMGFHESSPERVLA